MYLPQHFALPTDDAVELAGRVGVGHLVTITRSRAESTLVPFLIDRRDDRFVVLAHIAAANRQKQAIIDGASALLIVEGPNAYVSPGLYPSKVEHGRVVPTWNYAIVHVRGTLRRIDHHDDVLSLVTRLTDRHEAARSAPWSVHDAPPEFIDAQLKAIVGFELCVDEIEGKAKLSQNRPEPDRTAVRTAFLDGDEREHRVGEMMP